MTKLAPSILSADFSNLGNDINILDSAGVDYIHIDIMDGTFVPNISIGLPVIASIRPYTNIPFDVHLMISEPIRYIKEFADCGSDIITVHAEACTHLHRTLYAIKNSGKKAGVALNPATPLTILNYILDDIDLILLMSVNPGFGGATYIPSITNKIAQLRNQLARQNNPIDIEVDGGIKLDNVKTIINAGANVIVAGSSIFNGNPAKNIHSFKEKFMEEV